MGGASGAASSAPRDMSAVKCYNCDKMSHYKKDCRGPLRGPTPRAFRMLTQDAVYRKIFAHVLFSEPTCELEDIARVMSARSVTDDDYSSIVVTGEWSNNCVHVRVLGDSGADLSGVSSKIVEQWDIPIIAPLPHEQQYIQGATEGMLTKRRGYVVLRVTLHFPIPNGSTAITFTKKFEVMDMDLDFILGREVTRVIFPNDQANKFGGPHSPLTDVPYDVVRKDIAARVRRVGDYHEEVEAGSETFDVYGAPEHVRRACATSAAAPSNASPASSATNE